MKKISKKYTGIILLIFIFVIATGVSYFALGSIYGEEEMSAESAQKGAVAGGNGYEKFNSRDQEPSDNKHSTGRNTPFVSVGIGVAMGLVSLIAWEGSKRSGEDAVSLLIQKGLEDLTVRDLDITRQMMVKEEFTIPELLEYTSASRQSVWRLVKKLSEEGLVEEKDQKRLPKSGRGKPSQIYRYVGP